MKDAFNSVMKKYAISIERKIIRVNLCLSKGISDSSIKHMNKHLVTIGIVEGPMQHGPRHHCQMCRVSLLTQGVGNVPFFFAQELKVRNPSGEYRQVGKNQSSIDSRAFLKPCPCHVIRNVSLVTAILNKRFAACGELRSRVEQPQPQLVVFVSVANFRIEAIHCQ